MHSKSDIGFGKKIRASWLDLSLRHAASGRTFADAKSELADLVIKDNPGDEAVRKVLSCLNRIWFNPPEWCRATRDAGVEIFCRSDTAATRFMLHWGMSISAYPFVGSVAEIIGRLIKLQGLARISDIKRRIQEKYGDRDFVQRIVRYVISSFLDWEGLRETKTQGEYAPGTVLPVGQANDVAWLTEALLHARTEAFLPLTQLRQHPMLYPFQLSDVGGLSSANPRIHVLRHGPSEDVVKLTEARAS